jgi:3-methyladenine DNA glycosylase AlkD
MLALKIKKELVIKGSKIKASLSQRFFKTGKGEYGEGDIFIGLTVPEVRLIVKKYSNDVALEDISILLKDPIHEVRLCALLILVKLFEKALSDIERKNIFDFYCKHIRFVNNWDLVDASARFIVGDYLYGKPVDFLCNLVHSKSLWERRIAIVATHAFILKGDFRYTKRIAKLLLNDKEDLIHKASGWMLREMGKKSEGDLKEFLDSNASSMPRTMLRYSIEKLSTKEKGLYMLSLIHISEPTRP